jgi:hypothetical protein
MRRMQQIAMVGAIAFVSAIVASASYAQIKAFPQAEGFGAIAKGGRGGDVYHVTNLNDSGTGSLRFGIDNAPTTGRTIVFDVGGWITLNSKLGIVNTKRNITIAGQTAPGGIGVRGNQFSIGGDDIVVRHMRFRPGKGAGRVDSAGANADAERVIYDHVSAGYSYDENFSVQATDLTLQYSTVNFGLEDHSAGSLLENPHRLSMHHNLYAHNNTRNPKHRVLDTLDWVDNVIYNWDARAFYMEGTTDPSFQWKANVDGNYFIAGPNQGSTKPISGGSTQNYETWWGTNAYDADGDNLHDGVNYVFGQRDFSDVSSAATRWKNTTADPGPFPVADEIWKDASPQAAYERVLAEFGATPWDRDEIDSLLYNDVVNRQGGIISHENQLVARGVSNAGFGVLGGGAAAVDSDGDGMPNAWETKHGTNPNVANNNGDFDFDGYTDLEEYLNDLAAFKAVGPIEFSGIGRYADWKRWTNRWEPSRVDEVRVGNAAAFVDAVGQKAGTLRVGQGGRLYVTSGWLEVTDDLFVASSDGTSRVEQHGGEVRVGGTVYLGQGKYELKGGKLTTEMLVDFGGSEFAFTGGTLQAGLISFDLVNDGGTLLAEESTAFSFGITNITGNLTIHSGAIDVLLSSNPVNEFDVSGVATLGGSLNVLLGGGFVPSVGQSWKFLTASSFVGSFDSITAGYSVAQIGNSLWLTAGAGAGGAGVSVPEPGSTAMATIGVLLLLGLARSRRFKTGGSQTRRPARRPFDPSYPVLVFSLVVMFGVGTSHAATLKVSADAELRENSANADGSGATSTGSGTGAALNARWNPASTPSDKNEWIALKFDLSAYSDKTWLENIALRTTMARSNTNNTKTLRIYAVTPGTAGENWNEATITYGTMPGITFDANSKTNLLDVGGALQYFGPYSVSGVESEGNVALINPASLTSLVQGMGTNNLLTLLISVDASSNGQWRIASREATQTDTGVLTGAVGSFAAYLQFDVVVPVVQGDYNSNGVVDAADYTVWRDRQGMSSLTNEEVSPNTVDVADYLYWRERFGATTPGGAGALAVAAVPEPAAWALLLFGTLAGVIARGR